MIKVKRTFIFEGKRYKVGTELNEKELKKEVLEQWQKNGWIEIVREEKDLTGKSEKKEK
jgi:phage terminase large subunit-like protein